MGSEIKLKNKKQPKTIYCLNFDSHPPPPSHYPALDSQIVFAKFRFLTIPPTVYGSSQYGFCVFHSFIRILFMPNQ